MNTKSIIWKIFNWLNKYIAAPRMVMGYTNPGGVYLPTTRISNTTCIVNPKNLILGDNIFIGHYNFIEASNQISIGEGCQITNYISILSHSSHISIRLYGKHYISQKEHIGYVRGAVKIGAYSFIGPHVTIMPGTSIGKGSIISAYSFVKGTFPDFAIIGGNPAQIIGDTRDMDRQYLDETPSLQDFYNEWTKV
ncbi:MAG: acyltransferase [Burkholderiales bacterium]|jgi:acetyltransferase-like isoleucine patch superfamily enzyme|nr:acyltransferase [Burkholderiales bacterium]